MKNNIDKNVKVLSVKNLRKYFKVGAGKGSFTVKAIDDISFDVYKGEVFGLVGESGCGKTTTGRTLLKLYSPTDGTVDFAYQSEGDSYETVRIGAGHSGNRHRIKKARANYKLNVLAYKPYYSQRYDITSLSKKELTEKYNEKNELKNNLKLQKIKNIQLSKEFKQLMYENYQNYILTIDDIKFDNYSRILDLENEDHKNSLSYINYQIKFLKKNHKIRVGAIKDSAALSKEEVKLQLDAVNEEYNEERTILLEQKEAFILEKSSNDVESKLQIKLRKKEIKDELKVSFDKLKSNYYARNTELRKQYGESILGVTENTDGFLVKFKLLFSELILRRKNKHLLSTYKADIKVVKKDILDIKIKKAKAILKLFFARIKNRKTYENNKVEIAKLKTDLRLTVKAEKEGIKEQEKSNSVKNSSNVMSKIQMIFQDPIESLNPRMTVREIVAEGLIVQGVKDKDYIDKKVVNMLEMVGLSAEYLSRYPHEFSGGQRQRIGIARALIMEPEFIIADEPVSALDVSIQAQVINLLNDLKLKLGLTILFIAHDLSVIKYFTDRVAVMNRGKIVELASSEELFANPIHPYTKSLISAIPQPDPIAETTRKRINYDMSMHDYQVNKPFMHELDNEHFVYASDEELKTWIGEDEK